MLTKEPPLEHGATNSKTIAGRSAARCQLKQLAIRLGKSLLVLVIAVAAFLGYAAYAERSAADKATAFCGSIVVSANTSDILPKAISYGADARVSRWYKDEHGRSVMHATLTGASPFSRYICKIEAEHDRVTSRRVIYLD